MRSDRTRKASRASLFRIAPPTACLCLLALSWFVGESRAQFMPIGTERNGIAASVSVEGDAATVRWRIRQPPLSSDVHVTAAVNGRPLDDPIIEPYPGSTGNTLVLLLLDLSDPQREAQIRRDKLMLFRIAARAKSHQQLAIGVYADTPQLLVPADRKIATLATMVAAAKPRAAPANLNRALQETMRVLAASDAERRAIYILTDGHFDDAIDATQLSGHAVRSGIALSFLVAPSARSVDLPLLRQIAAATGGVVVGEGQRDRFLQAPFTLLDSGGSARFSLAAARRYIWEDTAELGVAVAIGDRRIALVAEPPVRLANRTETLVYLWHNHPVALVLWPLGAIALIASLVTLVVLLRRRRKARAVPSRSKPPVAPSRSDEPAGQRIEVPARAAAAEPEPEPELTAEEMWTKVFASLRKRGALPLNGDRMTPADIAAHLAKGNDVRVHEFVRGYYYPRRYGEEPGTLIYAEALALVRSIESRQTAADMGALLATVAAREAEGDGGPEARAREETPHAFLRFARDVLGPADNLRRAVHGADGQRITAADAATQALLERIERTRHEFVAVLARHGIMQVEAHGRKFDPHVDEAIYDVLDPTVDEGTVVRVLQPGYRVGERLLRPTRVAVSKGGAKTPSRSGNGNDAVRPKAADLASAVLPSHSIASLARDLRPVANRIQEVVDGAQRDLHPDDPARGAILEGLALTRRELLDLLDLHSADTAPADVDPAPQRLHA